MSVARRGTCGTGTTAAGLGTLVLRQKRWIPTRMYQVVTQVVRNVDGGSVVTRPQTSYAPALIIEPPPVHHSPNACRGQRSVATIAHWLRNRDIHLKLLVQRRTPLELRAFGSFRVLLVLLDSAPLCED